MPIGIAVTVIGALAAAGMGSPLSVVTLAQPAIPAKPLRHLDYRLRAGDPRVVPAPLLPAMTEAPTSDERWTADLIAVDRRSVQTGTPPRRPRLAAGLSLRVTNDDGTLASQIDMVGAAGRALSRLVSEAADF